MPNRSAEKDKERKIAKDHISELFIEAEKAFKKDPSLSDKYVKKARDIQMKFRLRMPAEYKRQMCKKCYSFLVSGKNSRVRINDGKVIYYCFKCKNIFRIPLKPKKPDVNK